MKNPTARFLLVLIAAADAFVWYQIAGAHSIPAPQLHFLNVGQGDSELLLVPGVQPVSVLTDAGPDGSVAGELESLGSFLRRRIDVAVVTHPQADHFNGFNFLLGRYSFGAILLNGRNDDPSVAEWAAFLEKARALRVPLITVGADDAVRVGETVISFVSPDASSVESGELNDTGLVEYVKTPSFTALLAADIDAAAEERLAARGDIRADVLKVAHHGSKYSSSAAFLAAVHPAVAVIEDGKNNRYGFPTKAALARLAEVTQNVFRTDEDGMVSIIPDGATLAVYAENRSKR